MEKVKIVVFVPQAYSDIVRKAMGDAGAGVIGNYSHCTFSSNGFGRFIPSDKARPHVGKANELETVEEERIEILCDKKKAKDVIKAMKKVHPYEEVAYDVYELVDFD